MIDEFLRKCIQSEKFGDVGIISNAREELAKDNDYDEHYHKILYRPFDNRLIYYCETIIERMRFDIMQHMLKPNISLCFVRQYSGDSPYSHALDLREYDR